MTSRSLADLPLLLSRQDVLELSGWSKDTYTEMVKSKDLPVASHTPGGQARFAKSTVLRVLGLSEDKAS